MAGGLNTEDLERLAETALLGGLSPGTLETLLSDAIVKTVERGETVFVQGEPAEAFYVVLDGWVKLYLMSRSGEEVVVSVFTRGQSFAEAATFTKGEYPVSAEGVTESRLLVVPAHRLFERIRLDPEIGLSMLASTSRHLHGLVRQIQQLKAHTGAQRLAEFLLSLAPVGSGSCTIALPYDKALIAAHLGMKPESLSRAFARLKESGVAVKRNMATIKDIGRLRDFFEQERAEVLKSRH